MGHIIYELQQHFNPSLGKSSRVVIRIAIRMRDITRLILFLDLNLPLSNLRSPGIVIIVC